MGLLPERSGDTGDVEYFALLDDPGRNVVGPQATTCLTTAVIGDTARARPGTFLEHQSCRRFFVHDRDCVDFFCA